MPRDGADGAPRAVHLLGERGQLAFQSVYPLLERRDLVTQRGQTGAQGHLDGNVLRIFDQRADPCGTDVARARLVSSRQTRGAVRAAY